MQVKGQYSVYGCFNATIQCLWLSEKLFLRLTTIERSTYFFNVNVSAKNHIFNSFSNLDTYNMMIVLQKLKFMQEFTFAIDVKCLNTDQQYVRFLKTQEISEKTKTVKFLFLVNLYTCILNSKRNAKICNS